MTTADFILKANDTGPSIQAALTSNGSPVDLSAAGVTVSFIMKPSSGNAVKFKSPAVIVAPATSGVVRYDWSASDTATPGDYLGEWEVTFSVGRKQSFPTLTYHSITILADLDGA